MLAVADILNRFGDDCRPSQIEPLGCAGGLSGAQFWRGVAPRGTLVLRRWPVEHPTPDKLRFIHAVLQHAASRGMKILPVPIATRDGATLIEHGGHLWELTHWLPGVADYDRSPSVEKLHAAMTTLAEFHNAVADFPTAGDLRVAGAAPAITTRLERLRYLQSGGLESLSRAISPNIWPELAPLAHQFVAALPRAIPPAIVKLAPLVDVEFPLQPCIRDIWHAHLLFEGNRVTGLIDFGAMQVDTPATDVARLAKSLLDTPPRSGEGRTSEWQQALAAYSTIRPLTNPERQAIPALDASGTILAGCNWIRWLYVEGREFDRRQVLDRFHRIVANFAI